MLKNVLEFIKKNNLIETGDRILIGLSGGADSVCLTHILCSLKSELNIELFAAHVNHGIRGEEAKRDEDFVQCFAKLLDIPVFAKHADVISEAKNRGISEEMCGRQIRYEFFEQISKEHNINKIATAHNKNDTAETVLMNFIRGSSLAGLCGIPARRGNIIRPILSLTREDILSYIKENNLDFVTDSTNLETVYTRNKIRLQLIPQIQNDFNANFIETTVKNAENISYDREFLEIATDKALQNCLRDGKIDISAFNEEHISIQRRILYKMLTAKTGASDISSSYIDDLQQLINSESGKKIDLPHDIEAVLEYNYLIIRKKQEDIADFEYELHIGEETEIKELGIKVILEESNDKNAITVPENSVFTIRNRRNGDYFYPEGMTGKKKLKDYFIDEKIPRDERKKIALLTVNGEIAYIINKRRDRRFKLDTSGVKLVIIK